MAAWEAESSYFDLELSLELISGLEASISEQQAHLETLKDGVKTWLKSQSLEQSWAGQYSVSWKPYVTHRFDSQEFKAEHEELYEQYNQMIVARRFVVR